MTSIDTDPSALRISERIRATPDIVFDYLVDPEKLLRWMGTEADIEPRPGGKFWLNITGTDIASGSYVEVDRPNRVVFTWGWEGSADVPPGSSTVSLSLTADGDETVVDLVHAGLPGGSADPHEGGWRFFLPRLILVAEGGEIPPDAPAHP